MKSAVRNLHPFPAGNGGIPWQLRLSEGSARGEASSLPTGGRPF